MTADASQGFYKTFDNESIGSDVEVADPGADGQVFITEIFMMCATGQRLRFHTGAVASLGSDDDNVLVTSVDATITGLPYAGGRIHVPKGYKLKVSATGGAWSGHIRYEMGGVGATGGS